MKFQTISKLLKESVTLNDTPRHVAEQFAAALDEDDFETTFSLLDENCIYTMPNKQIAGRSEIIASYRESSEWGKMHLDEVEYSSEVMSLQHEEYVIRFLDKIRFQEQPHTYWCKQIVRLNSSGKICFIEHREDPEQRILLDEFFRNHGLVRG